MESPYLFSLISGSVFVHVESSISSPGNSPFLATEDGGGEREREQDGWERPAAEKEKSSLWFSKYVLPLKLQ